MFQGLHFGFTGAIDAPAEMNTQMGKSFEIGVDNLIYYGHSFGASGRNMIQVGMGINWRNYRMTGENRFDMDGDNVLVTGYPEDAEGKFSRIKVFSLTFPIAYSYRTPVKALGKSNLGFKLSAMLNWNSHASMLTQYVLADGSKVKEKYDRIGQRKFSVDIQLGVQVAPAVCLYVKYTPFDLFKSGTTSPKFQTISTGVRLRILGRSGLAKIAKVAKIAILAILAIKITTKAAHWRGLCRYFDCCFICPYVSRAGGRGLPLHCQRPPRRCRLSCWRRFRAAVARLLLL